MTIDSQRSAVKERETGHGALHAPQDWHGMADRLDWEVVERELRLSPRELQLVRHILEGKKLSAIARELDLGLGTVKTYSRRVHRKLGVTNGVELALAVFDAHLR